MLVSIGVAPGEAVDINALRTTYLGRVLKATSALPLAGIDRVDVQVGETAAPAARNSLRRILQFIAIDASLPLRLDLFPLRALVPQV